MCNEFPERDFVIYNGWKVEIPKGEFSKLEKEEIAETAVYFAEDGEAAPTALACQCGYFIITYIDEIEKRIVVHNY